jgi:hypothetical protein
MTVNATDRQSVSSPAIPGERMHTVVWVLAALACALVPMRWTEAQEGDSAASAPAWPAVPDPEPAAETTWRTWDFSAVAREEWRLRAVGLDEVDHRGHLTLDVSARHASDRLSVIGAADLWVRAGARPAGGLQPATIYDARNPWLDLLALAVQWRPGGVVRDLRAGRQETPLGPAGTFDGLALRAGPAGVPLDLFVYGGRSVFFFSVLDDDAERWLGAAGAAWRPLPSLRVEADYRFTSEARLPSERPGAATGPRQEHGYGLAVAWRTEDLLSARLAVRGLDASVAQVSAVVTALLPLDLTLHAAGALQPATLRDVSESSTAYFATLGESLPFARASLDLSRPVVLAGTTVDLHAGWRVRRLLDGVEGPFNRNLGGAWLLAGASAIAGTGLFATASIERVGRSASLDDEGLWALGGSLGWDRGALRAEIGTGYQRYRYSYYATVEELVDVRTAHAEVRWTLSRRLALRARYVADVADRTYQTFTLSAAQVFE